MFTLNSITFTRASIVWNGYYNGYIITFQSEDYFSGKLSGISGVSRMGHEYLIQDAVNVIVFKSLESAFEFCDKWEVESYVGKWLYHVENGRIYIPSEK